MRLFSALAGAALVLLLAGAAAATTQVSPEAPGLLGAIAQFFACGDPEEAALLARDLLDEAEFASLLGAQAEAGP
ncbi:hypothetical protein ACFQS7_14255 [Dankookia sp. GCM10030260]|uniref:hypothetical protein n=1 Tax=Dankookia sp. GCM10030260 TaxID=3273390 RepID=UPI00360DACC0